MNIRDIKAETTARLAALGRKATSDLVEGECFSYCDEVLTFNRWLGAPYSVKGIPYRSAYVTTVENKVSTRRLNQAGSVKMLEFN